MFSAHAQCCMSCMHMRNCVHGAIRNARCSAGVCVSCASAVGCLELSIIYVFMCRSLTCRMRAVPAALCRLTLYCTALYCLVLLMWPYTVHPRGDPPLGHFRHPCMHAQRYLHSCMQLYMRMHDSIASVLHAGGICTAHICA
jgi:hypothetical protein